MTHINLHSWLNHHFFGPKVHFLRLFEAFMGKPSYFNKPPEVYMRQYGIFFVVFFFFFPKDYTLVWHLLQNNCLQISHFWPLEKIPNLVFKQWKHTCKWKLISIMHYSTIYINYDNVGIIWRKKTLNLSPGNVITHCTINGHCL